MTDAKIGYGSKLAISTNGGGLYTDLAEIFNITPPSSTFDMVDATHMQSPNSDREFIIGLNDPGEASFEMNFVPGSASDVLIRSVKAARAAVLCRVTFPNGATWTFTGLLMTYEPAVPNEDKMTATVTFKVSGSTTVGAESAPTNTTLPAISGVAQEGELLTAWPGVWTGGPTFTYVWKNEGVAIGGAAAATYTPVVGDVGDNITVTVTGTNSAGNAAATSAETLAVIAA